MKKVLVIALLMFGKLHAQPNLTVSLSQDVALAIYEDDNGLSPFTPNLTLKARLNGSQRGPGYLTIGSYLEYADLAESYQGDFWRYGIEGGYSFNDLYLFGITYELRSLIGFGIINRNLGIQGAGTYHFGIELSVKLFNGLNLLADGFFLYRSDLYENKKLQPNFKLGLEYNFTF